MTSLAQISALNYFLKLRSLKEHLIWIFITFALLVTSTFVTADEVLPTAVKDNVLEVFVRDGCPHCSLAKEYLTTLAAQRPELEISVRPVDKDTSARDDLLRYSQNANIWPPGVPMFVMDGEVLMGFDSTEETGPELLDLVDRRLVVDNTVDTGLFGTLSLERLGLPAFTLALGLLDGFNPCATWVLLFLLSLLVHLHDRKRMAIVAGTFVVVSGLVYYAFMAAWLNVFLLVGISATLQMVLGVIALMIGIINVKDFIRPSEGFSLSIPDSAKPGIYTRMRKVLNTESILLAMGGVAMLAIVVNFIELICTAGFPAVYTSILTQQGVSSSSYYGYLGLYIVGYVVDDTLMVTLAVVALSSRKLSAKTGQWLKLISGIVMLGLGLTMIFRPEWLS